MEQENKADLQGLINRIPYECRAALSEDLWEHGARVSVYASILYHNMLEYGYIGDAQKLSPKQLTNMETAMVFHDIGKMATPREVLYKPAPLDSAEWSIMHKHPGDGAILFHRLFERVAKEPADEDFWVLCMEVIVAHHEHWNGGGYPQGLAGDNIPLLAQICAIADAYDSITSFCTYRKTRTHEQACREIEQQAGKQFNPVLVEALGQCKHKFEQAMNGWDMR